MAKRKFSTPKKLLTLTLALVVASSITISCTASSKSSGTSTSSAKTTASKFNYVSPSDLSSSTSSSSSSSKASSSSKSSSSSPSNNSSGSNAQGNPPSGGGSGSAPGNPPSGGGGGGANTQSYDYSGSYSGKITANGKSKTVNKKTITQSKSESNALLAENGGKLTVKNSKVKKSGSTSGDDASNFYGVNSSGLAIGSASRLYFINSSITSTSSGSNGLFATDGATIFANNSTITTKNGDNSRGLDATYGGKIYANKMTISTEGNHSASVATDRGGGYISLTNSKLKTAGSGSPLLYSTGDIEVDNVTGTASGSQLAGIEGKNRILVYNSTLTSTNDAISGSDPIKNGVIIYQSTSGDADTASNSVGDFEAVNSTLKTSITSGAMFYVTNTNAKIVLQNTRIKTGSSKVALLNASGNNSNSWGSAGSNGGNVTLTAIDQKLSGTIQADTISKVKVYLTKGSKWTGSTKITTNSSGTTSKSPISITIQKGSTWVVTKNSTVSNLYVQKGAKIVDKNGKPVTIKVNGKTKVKGTSKLTVNVTGTYSTKASVPSSAARSTKVLKRTAFDSYFNTKTTFGKN